MDPEPQLEEKTYVLMFAREDVFPNQNYFGVLLCSLAMAMGLPPARVLNLLFSLVLFFWSKFPVVMSSDFCQKESKRHFSVKKW